jgi:site-specific recombinase XerD
MPTSAKPLLPSTRGCPLAVAAYLARLRGLSVNTRRRNCERFLGWCAERDIEPLGAQRQHLELYVRWMQETRRYKPSTVSRRTSVLAGFYRTCVIDGVLEHSPAEFVPPAHRSG